MVFLRPRFLVGFVVAAVAVLVAWSYLGWWALLVAFPAVYWLARLANWIVGRA